MIINRKNWIWIFSLLIVCPLVSGVDMGSSSGGGTGVVITIPEAPINYSTIERVNSSDFWDDLDDPSDLLLSMFDVPNWIDTDLDLRWFDLLQIDEMWANTGYFTDVVADNLFVLDYSNLTDSDFFNNTILGIINNVDVLGNYSNQIWNRSGTNVILNHLGDSVGIGTTSPTTALDVVGDGNFSGNVYSRNLYLGVTNSPLVQFNVNGNPAYQGQVGYWWDSNNAFRINVGAGNTQIMGATNAGNRIFFPSAVVNITTGKLYVEGDLITYSNLGVGIGTPEKNLVVYDAVGGATIRLQNAPAGAEWEMRRDVVTGHFVFHDDGAGDVVIIEQTTGDFNLTQGKGYFEDGVTTHSHSYIGGDLTIKDSSPTIAIFDTSVGNREARVSSNNDGSLFLRADHQDVDAGSEILFWNDNAQMGYWNNVGLNVSGNIELEGGIRQVDNIINHFFIEDDVADKNFKHKLSGGVFTLQEISSDYLTAEVIWEVDAGKNLIDFKRDVIVDGDLNVSGDATIGLPSVVNFQLNVQDNILIHKLGAGNPRLMFLESGLLDMTFTMYDVGGRLGLKNNNEAKEIWNWSQAGNAWGLGNLRIEGNFTGNQIYGEMGYHNHTGTTLTFPDTVWSYMYFTNATNLNGFTYVGGFMESSNLTCQVAGKYQAIYRLSGSGQNNHIYHSNVFVNSVVRNELCGDHKKMSAGGDVSPMGGNCFIDLNVGDDVAVAVRDFGGAGDGDYYSGVINLVRIGNGG